MVIKGNVVADIATCFRRTMTIEPERPANTFLMDESGGNTHVKDDAKKGGEKKVIRNDEIPKEEVGVGEAHFTVAPKVGCHRG